MKEITTFVGNSGKSVAVLYEMGDDGRACGVCNKFYQVNYTKVNEFGAEKSFKVFVEESEASKFALEYISDKSKLEFLSE